MSITNITVLSPSSSYSMLDSINASGAVIGDNIVRVELLNAATSQGIITIIPTFHLDHWIWSTTNVELTSGSNTISVTAFDSTEASLSTDIIITKKSINIAILSPNQETLQTTESITISGEITGEVEDGDIATLTIVNDQITDPESWNATLSFETDKYTWSANISLKDVALNSIIVTATNSATESIQADIAIQMWLATITINNIVAEATKYTSLAQIPISGTITGDAGEISSIDIANTQTTSNLAANFSHDGSKYIWDISNFSLEQGTNNITITATNSAGAIKSVVINLVSDSIKPYSSFSITDNAANIPTTESDITLTFNKNMDRTSVISALSMSPLPTSGTWQSDPNDATIFTFNYAPPLDNDTTYTIQLLNTAQDYLKTIPVGDVYITAENFVDATTYNFTSGAYKGKLYSSERLDISQFFRYIPQTVPNTFRYKQYKGSLIQRNYSTEFTVAQEFEYIPAKLVNTFRYREFKGQLYRPTIEKQNTAQVILGDPKINKLHLFNSPNDTYQVRTTQPELKWQNPIFYLPKIEYKILLSQSPNFTNNIVFDTQTTPEVFQISDDNLVFVQIPQNGIIPKGYVKFKCPFQLPEGNWYLKLLIKNRRAPL